MIRALSGPHALRWSSAVLGGCWIAAAFAASIPLALSLVSSADLAGTLRWGTAMLLVAAAWRPFEAALVVAAFAPLGRTLATLAGGSGSATDLMVPALLVGAAAWSVRRPRGVADTAPALVASATFLAALALASVAVGMAAETPFFARPAEWRREVLDFLSQQYYFERDRFRTLVAGFQLAQGVLLVPLVARLACDETRRVRLAAMLVAGAAAAGAQVMLRVLTASVASGHTTETLLRLTSDVRVIAAFPDFNAAGSFYAIAAAVALGLLLAVRRTVGPFGPALALSGLLLSLIGLWLSGSRVAMAALPMAGLLVALMLPSGTRWFTPRRLAWIAATALLTLALVAAAQVRRGGADGGTAMLIRVEFVKTTWRMLQDHPLFGVGAGQYAEHSGRYSSARLRRYYPRENAHNNFMQIAGELGPLALMAFVAVCATALARSVGRLRVAPGDRINLGVLAASLAFLLTCLAGHPLLVVEAAVPFWLVTGQAGAAAAPGGTRRTVWCSTGLVIGLLALVASAPARAEAARRALDLEHVLLGEHRWVRVDGLPQVQFRGSVAVYVPAQGQRALIAVRPADPGGRPVQLTLRLDGHLADVVRVEAPEWHTTVLLMPAAVSRRFRLLEIQARWADGAPGQPLVTLRRIEALR